MKPHDDGRVRLSVKRVGIGATIGVVLAAAAGLGVGEATASVNHPHGIVPLGSTNEGGTGAWMGAATGILDVIAGPCVGITTEAGYERLPSRITLDGASKIIAKTS